MSASLVWYYGLSEAIPINCHQKQSHATKVSRAAEVCGSTALFQKYPLERFYRDMHLHMTHGRHDIAAQIVGASELGEPYDVNRTH